MTTAAPLPPPPQCIEAEEAVLGAIMLDPEAIARVADHLEPKMFFLGIHRDIYQACLDLYRSGQQTDYYSLTDRLEAVGKLEAVGGQPRLAWLVDLVITTTNVDQYALIVMDKHFRRQLILACSRIQGAAFDTTRPLEQVFDLTLWEMQSIIGAPAEPDPFPDPPARPKPPKPIKRKATA